jgi:glycerol-3-phosphate acyltransferase PlsY
MTDTILLHVALSLLGYFFGSIPFGLILTRASGLGDIRTIGSGNIGATNVMRTGNKKLAVLTLLLDGLKGFVAVWISYKISFNLYSPEVGFDDSDSIRYYELSICLPYMLATGFFAIIGHIFPVWLKFKGGKGVATAIGVFLGVFWPLGVSVLTVWLLVFAISRISSLSALSGFFLASVFMTFIFIASTYPPNVFEANIGITSLSWITTCLIFFTHRANIKRLLKGEEPKFGTPKRESNTP